MLEELEKEVRERVNLLEKEFKKVLLFSKVGVCINEMELRLCMLNVCFFSFVL